MEQGLFITLEGGEGAGKTTQIEHLREALIQEGHSVVVTREPGGTPAAEELRGLLSHPEFGPEWTPEAETMLLYAARSMHIADVIKPALAQGRIVICDRYVDSTRVYQGSLQKMNPFFLECLEVQIIGDVMPHITFILDIPCEETIKRIEKRGGAKDHYDNADISFHEKIRQGFLTIAHQEPERCKIIRAIQDEASIAKEIRAKVTALIREVSA
ncbi:MAG: dTMP kinase [Alphaproteobacteria bacterium]|nr:dTMP kinase [Alphaproteobacteria bacterium]NCQ88011.1 dTMP kinase [Alphaproteobacteria bacterium]NCT05482.1 dTMP kinase [Alphaproteobacteria bacterium]